MSEVKFLTLKCASIEGVEPKTDGQGNNIIDVGLFGVDLYELFVGLKHQVSTNDLLEQFSDASIKEYMEKRGE